MPLLDPKNTDKTISNATNQTWNMAEDDQATEVGVKEMDIEMEDDET